MDLRKLDALVAEHVMGCRVLWQRATVFGPYCGCNCGDEDNFRFEEGPHSNPHRMDENLKDYSTDIAAAWGVVEKLKIDHALTIHAMNAIGKGWLVHLDRYIKVGADTAPLAICLASLKAKGIDVSEWENHPIQPAPIPPIE